MLKIAQYESLFSLYITFLLILPCVILCFAGKKFKILDLVISFAAICTILGIHTAQFVEFALFICFETALLFAFKAYWTRRNGKIVYYIFFALSLCPILLVRICSLHSTLSSFVGFTGISYMCFKIWQLLFEIHDGKIQKLSLVDFWLFVLFFPSFSSGPIARYESFLGAYEKPCGQYFQNYFAAGIKKIFLGLFYKFALAFFINKFVISNIPEQISFYNVVAYMYSYTLYLFFDFAGYSNIAIGVAFLMGVKLPENFNKPFLARDMKEFWNRWHMSLSTWFTDYAYGRFVLNNVRSGRFKSIKIAGRLGYLFTMTLMGLWHGFTLHYLIYGIYHGVLLILTEFLVKSTAYRKFRKRRIYGVISRVVCFQFIAIGMLIFSGRFLFQE